MFGRLGAVGDYSSLVNAAAAKYGLDPALINSVIQQESSGNPGLTSPAGAQGLMQLMPGTAASLGVTNPFDPAQNIDAGSRYLAQMISQFGSVDAGLAAYNWGPGNMTSGKAMPLGVQAYVSSVMANAGLTPLVSAPPSNGSLVDLSGAAASTPTSDILDSIDTTAANVLGLDPATAGWVMAGAAALIVFWLFRR